MARNQVTLTFAGDTRNLDRAAAKVRAATRRMGDDFDDLGKRAAKKLPETIFAQFGDAAKMALKAVPQQVQGVALGAGAAIGATMASAMGAAVTAGILLAVGGGVLAAGIAAALKSPAVDEALRGKVRLEGSAIGRRGNHEPLELQKVRITEGAIDRMKRSLDGFGKPFEGPVVRAVNTFADAVERMSPTLLRMGETLAPVVDKLAPALATMAEKALPGIERAATASVPLFEKLAEHGPALGEAFSKMFSLIAEGGPGATKFLGHLLTIIEVSIVTFGNAFGYLSKEYLRTVNMINSTKQFFVDVGHAISGAFRSAFNAVVSAWNNTVGRINFTVPDWVPGIGGNHFSVPKFHTGGIVPGALGAETLAVLRAGERVTPAGGGGTGQVITLRFGGDRQIVELIKRLVDIEGGGNVQAAFGR